MCEIMDTIVSVYEEHDVQLPDRQYIAMNSVAHDKEQLTIAFQQMYAGPPGNQMDVPVRCDGPRSIVLQIQLVRCIPVMGGRGQAPTPEQMIESTNTLTADVWLLMDAVLKSPPACDYLGAIADVSVTDPSGGMQAVQLNVSVGVP